MLFLCPFMQDYLSHYVLHNGSFFHSCGNPIERVLIFSLLSMRNKRRLEKSPFAAIDCSIYAWQHNWWYNLLGRKLPTTTHEEGKYSGIIGIVGKRLFQIRAWWAQAFRNTAMHFIQFSRYRYCGSLNSFATFFFTELSLKLQNNLDSVPKETTSNVFHAGGNDGEV